jgi:hypothetical protein
MVSCRSREIQERGIRRELSYLHLSSESGAKSLPETQSGVVRDAVSSEPVSAVNREDSPNRAPEQGGESCQTRQEIKKPADYSHSRRARAPFLFLRITGVSCPVTGERMWPIRAHTERIRSSLRSRPLSADRVAAGCIIRHVVQI